VVDGCLPRLWHRNELFGYDEWIRLLCANLGAAVCPPNFFLQSALVCTRRSERSTAGVLEAFEYNLYETSICLGLATLINAVMLVLAAAHFYPTKVVSMEQGAELLDGILGPFAHYAFAIGMLCAGQSSSLTGVLSTQYIMEGFFELSVPGWIVRVVTRILAIVPAFWVVYTYGSDSAADLIEAAQVVVNFVVPFTVIPLTKFLTSELKMGPFRLSKTLENVCWVCSAVAIFLNLMALYDFFVGLSGLPVALRMVLGLATIVVYLALSCYLIMRPVQVGTSGLWEDEKEAKEGQGVGFWVGDFRPTNQQMTILSVVMGLLAILVGYLAYNEAETLTCLLDHIGIIDDPSCDIVALRGRVVEKIAEALSLDGGAPATAEDAIDAALAMPPEALTETVVEELSEMQTTLV